MSPVGAANDAASAGYFILFLCFYSADLSLCEFFKRDSDRERSNCNKVCTVLMVREESDGQSRKAGNEHQCDHPRAGSLDVLLEKTIVNFDYFFKSAHEVSQLLCVFIPC